MDRPSLNEKLPTDRVVLLYDGHLPYDIAVFLVKEKLVEDDNEALDIRHELLDDQGSKTLIIFEARNSIYKLSPGEFEIAGNIPEIRFFRLQLYIDRESITSLTIEQMLKETILVEDYTYCGSWAMEGDYELMLRSFSSISSQFDHGRRLLWIVDEEGIETQKIMTLIEERYTHIFKIIENLQGVDGNHGAVINFCNEDVRNFSDYDTLNGILEWNTNLLVFSKQLPETLFHYKTRRWHFFTVNSQEGIKPLVVRKVRSSRKSARK